MILLKGIANFVRKRSGVGVGLEHGVGQDGVREKELHPHLPSYDIRR